MLKKNSYNMYYSVVYTQWDHSLVLQSACIVHYSCVAYFLVFTEVDCTINFDSIVNLS